MRLLTFTNNNWMGIRSVLNISTDNEDLRGKTILKISWRECVFVCKRANGRENYIGLSDIPLIVALKTSFS